MSELLCDKSKHLIILDCSIDDVSLKIDSLKETSKLEDSQESASNNELTKLADQSLKLQRIRECLDSMIETTS